MQGQLHELTRIRVHITDHLVLQVRPGRILHLRIRQDRERILHQVLRHRAGRQQVHQDHPVLPITVHRDHLLHLHLQEEATHLQVHLQGAVRVALVALVLHPVPVLPVVVRDQVHPEEDKYHIN
jgi:hypothetical protein